MPLRHVFARTGDRGMQFIFRSVRRSMAILLLTGLFASAGDMRTWTAQLVAPSMVNAVQPIFLASAPAADLPPPLEFKQPGRAGGDDDDDQRWQQCDGFHVSPPCGRVLAPPWSSLSTPHSPPEKIP